MSDGGAGALLVLAVFGAVIALLWPPGRVAAGTWSASVRQLPPGPDRRALLGWGAAIGAGVGLGLVMSPMIGLLAAGIVGARRWTSARAGARRDDQARSEALPAAIDLCTVVLGAGGTIRDCIDALAHDGPAAVRPLARQAVGRADGGHRLDEALRWLQLRLGPPFQPLTGTLLLATEHGGSIAVLLSRLAVEANASRRRLGELRARRLPVALLIPLVTCSLPAVIVGTVVPLAIVALGASR